MKRRKLTAAIWRATKTAIAARLRRMADEAEKETR